MVEMTTITEPPLPQEPPFRARMREFDEKHLRVRKEIEDMKAESKRLDAVIRSIDTKVPYSIRKAHYQKQERDDKRAAEASKKGILWTPVVLTDEESERNSRLSRIPVSSGCSL